MKNIVSLALVAVLCAGVAGGVAAKEHYREGSVKADTKEAFETLASSVRKEMEDGGKYEYVKPDERKKIDDALAKMTELFEQSGAVANMKEEQKIALFNNQEIVNSILTLRDRDRVICKKEAPVGSHIPVTSCHTYGQEVEAREGAKKTMDDWGRPLCAGNNPACHAQ